MLSHYVFDSRSRQRLQEVVADPHLDEFTDWLADLRYSHPRRPHGDAEDLLIMRTKSGPTCRIRALAGSQLRIIRNSAY